MITARHPYRDPGCTRRTGLAVMTDSAEVNKPAADPLVGRTVAQYAIVAKLGGGEHGNNPNGKLSGGIRAGG